MDVGGFDAGHKISILAALAFGCAPNFAAAEIEGIERGRPASDIKLAKDLGYRIKLVASAAAADGVLVKVHPSLAPLEPSAGPGRAGR
jgi:homoserine dehydrogenase